MKCDPLRGRLHADNTRKFVGLILLSLFAAGLFSAPPSAHAAGVPAIIGYQGRLTDSSGNLLGSSSGTTYYFKFSLWDSATVGSGTRLWPISVPATTTASVRQGVFTVNIGDTANGYLEGPMCA